MPKPADPAPMTSQLLKVADAFCAARELSRGRVSTLVFNDGKKLDLIEGGADLGTRKFEDALQWFSTNWPEGAVWPKAVARPSVAASSTG